MSEGATPTPANSRLERLSRAHERQLVEIESLRTKLKESEKSREDLSKTVEALKQTADESVAIKRVSELEGELRGVKHRKVLEKVAAKAGLKAEAVEGFYKLSDYKPDGEPDEAKITTFVEGKKAELGYLFDKPSDPNAPVTKPAVGSGQGGNPGDSSFSRERIATRLNDSAYVMNNYAAIANAAGEALARGELSGTG